MSILLDQLACFPRLPRPRSNEISKDRRNLLWK